MMSMGYYLTGFSFLLLALLPFSGAWVVHGQGESSAATTLILMGLVSLLASVAVSAKGAYFAWLVRTGRAEFV